MSRVEIDLTDGTIGSVAIHFRDPDTEPVDLEEAAVGVMGGALLLGEVIGTNADTGEPNVRLRILPLDTISEAIVIGKGGL